MATVLIGWELGAGIGQVMPLREIARRLAASGHEPVLIFSNVVDTAALFEPGEFRLLQAPSWSGQRRHAGGDGMFATYADVLAAEGFRSAGAIATIVAAWDGLLDLINPALIMANSAPALSIAARGRMPAMVLGNGFAMPPSELDVLPPLQEGVRPNLRQSDLVAAINQVQVNRGRPAFAALPALFDGDAKYILTLPTLDPYADHRQSPADGPLIPLATPSPLPPADSVFAYFDAEQPKLRMIMEGLSAAALPTRLFVRGAPLAALERLAGPNIEIVAEIPAMADMIRQSSVAVHDGGLYLAATALSIGRPQMILPRALERQLTARRIEDLGAAVTLPGQFNAGQFNALLTNAANSGRMARRASEVAGDLARGERRDLLSDVAAKCEELLGSG